MKMHLQFTCRPNNGTVGGVERVLRPEEPPQDQIGRALDRAVYEPGIPYSVTIAFRILTTLFL